MDTWQVDNELVEMAEAGRDLLSDDFFRLRDLAENALSAGQEIPAVVARGAGSDGTLYQAIVAELHDLLCSNSERYAEVRHSGKSFARAIVPAIVGYVVGALGVSAAVATAGVSFLALTVLRFGSGVFCRLSAPRGEAAKGPGIQ